MKPLLLGGVLLLAGAGTTVGALMLASSGEEEAAQQVSSPTFPGSSIAPTPPASTPSPTPDSGSTLWRWMDVTVLIPDDSGIRAFPDTIYFDNPGLEPREGLALRKDDPADSDIHSYVLIDAEDGTIYPRPILDEHRAEMDLVLSTVDVTPFDPATAPWPYNGDPPEQSVSEAPSIRPHPATGMYVSFVTGSYGRRGSATPAECEVVADGMGVRNARSSAGIGLDPNTGAICKNLTYVQPEDLTAFERFLDRVALCVYEDTEC